MTDIQQVQAPQQVLRQAREALLSARAWVSGDKWRFSNDPSNRQAWAMHADNLDATVAKLDAALSLPAAEVQTSDARGQLAQDIKNAIEDLAGGRNFPDLMDAVDALTASPQAAQPVSASGTEGVQEPPLGRTKDGWLAHRKYDGLCGCDNCWDRYAAHYGLATPTGEAAGAAVLPTLWCVNVQGPDDVYAMPSKAAALERANELNVYFGRLNETSTTPEYDPIMRAVVIEWPHSAESHAKALHEVAGAVQPASLSGVAADPTLLADLRHRAAFWRSPHVGDVPMRDATEDFARELDRAIVALSGVAAPAGASPLTPEQTREIAHRTCTEYRHMERVRYGFAEMHLWEFVRRIEAAHGIGSPSAAASGQVQPASDQGAT